jgi:DNA-binding NarL/FixJ family response regulator
MQRIRVLICDRQPLIRSGLRATLEQLPDVEILAEAGAREVVPLARRMNPDLVLTEIDLPVRQGIKIVRLLARPPNDQPVRVLVLTQLGEKEYIFAALRAGARGILLKDGTLEELHAGIRAVAGGHGVIAPPIVTCILDQVALYLPDHPADSQLLEKLTPRERQVLSLVAHGDSNVRISRKLGLSQATVRSHIHHVLVKFGLEDRTQAVAFVYRMGLISPVVEAQL